jgi:hypothetical protein
VAAVAARSEIRVKNHLEAVMASVKRTTAMTLGGVISLHKTRVLRILRSPAFPANRAYLLLIVVSDSKAVSSGLSELGWLELQEMFVRYSKGQAWACERVRDCRRALLRKSAAASNATLALWCSERVRLLMKHAHVSQTTLYHSK